MTEQGCSNSLSLVFVNDCEGHFGFAGLCNDVTPGPDDGLLAVLTDHGHQRNVGDEVDVDVEIGLLFGKSAFGTEEAAVKRFGADASDSRQHRAPILRLKR